MSDYSRPFKTLNDLGRRLRTAFVSALMVVGCLPVAAQDTEHSQPVEPRKESADIAAKTKVVQRHIDAYRARDLDGFIATFAKDAEVYANGMVAVGHKQIKALYALNFAPGAPDILVKNSGMSGPFVFVSISFVLSDGQEVCCSYSEYEVIDGKITYLAASG